MVTNDLYYGLRGGSCTCPPIERCPIHQPERLASGPAAAQTVPEQTAKALNEAYEICVRMEPAMTRMLGHATTAHYDAGIPIIAATLAERDAAFAALQQRVEEFYQERVTLLATASDWLQRYNEQKQTIAEQAQSLAAKDEEIARLRAQADERKEFIRNRERLRAELEGR